jgi:hypothetical protein
MKTMMSAVTCLGLFAALALAADISGKWTGDMPGRGGDTMPATFNFKADGDKLTGTMTGPQGDVPLQEGKISGDNVSFSTTLDFGGNSVKIVYKGTVSGDTMKMSREREGSGQPREFTIKRAGK